MRFIVKEINDEKDKNIEDIVDNIMDRYDSAFKELDDDNNS